jgi:hypothetical protein
MALKIMTRFVAHALRSILIIQLQISEPQVGVGLGD